MTAAPDLRFEELRELYEVQAERARACKQRADATSICAALTTVLAIGLCVRSESVPPVLLLAALLFNAVCLHVEVSGLLDSSFLSVNVSMVALRNIAAAQREHKRVTTLPGDLLPLLVAHRGVSDYLLILRWRIRRTYIWLFTAVFGAWLFLLDSPSTAAIWHPRSIFAHAGFGPITGSVVIVGVVVVYAAIAAIAVIGRRNAYLDQFN